MIKMNQSKKKSLFSRTIVYVLTGTMMVFLLTGCKKTNSTGDTGTPTPTATATATATSTPTPTKQTGDTDAVSSASIVDTQSAFEKAISAQGTWIIAITKDLTVDKELVLDGEFTNGKKDDNGKDIVQRKIALYSQDDQRNITARYTLTAPKITIKSPYASLQHGKFVGDVIVDAPNFQLIDNVVQGNLYFTSQDVKDSFTMDATSSVSGVQEIKK